MSRSYVACDGCAFGAWIGAGDAQVDAWCEACQQPAVLALPADPGARCPACGERLTTTTPRFEELFGEIQNLVAVLEAWLDRPARLQPLVPERPRFLTDLHPPPRLAGDPDDLSRALDALVAGTFRAARAGFDRIAVDAAADPAVRLRVAMGLGIACQRQGDLSAAERAFERALAADPDHAPARLDRGALRARRGDFRAAREDFEHAGDSYEARWNRAALTVLEAVATTPGLPDRERIEAARAEAGAPSEFWSDPTVGRLLFTLVVERARSRTEGGETSCADARVVRAAEAEIEFDSFTDRAMVLLGYHALRMKPEAARVARPLALAVIAALNDEPFARGPAGRELAASLRRTAAAVEAADAATALAEIAGLVERSDLRHYRIPCARCRRGSIGVEQVAEAGAEAAGE